MESAIPAPVEQKRTRVRLPWLLVLGALLLVVAGAAVAVVTRSSQTQYSTSTPVGTVQRYLELLQEGKTAQAYQMTELDVSPSQYTNMMQGWSSSSHRVTLVSSHQHGDTATVTVAISTFSSDPTATGTNSTQASFTLNRSGHRWLITGPDFIPSA